MHQTPCVEIAIAKIKETPCSGIALAMLMERCCSVRWKHLITWFVQQANWSFCNAKVLKHFHPFTQNIPIGQWFMLWSAGIALWTFFEINFPAICTAKGEEIFRIWLCEDFQRPKTLQLLSSKIRNPATCGKCILFHTFHKFYAWLDNACSIVKNTIITRKTHFVQFFK